MRFRNASGERIRLGSGARMNDTDCCCGEEEYATCLELMAVVVPAALSKDVELIFPAVPPSLLPTYHCSSAGTPYFSPGAPYIFTNPTSTGSGVDWEYDTGDGFVRFGIQCFSGSTSRMAYGFDGYDLTGLCSDATMTARPLPLTVTEVFEDGELEFTWPGITFSFV